MCTIKACWPDSGPANLLLGTINRKNGEKEKAVYYYKKVLKFDPFNIKAHYNIALLYSETGNKGKADYHLKIIQNLQPGLLLKLNGTR